MLWKHQTDPENEFACQHEDVGEHGHGLRLKQCSIEMWLQRKLLRIGCSDNISNNSVLIGACRGKESAYCIS